MAGKNAIAQRLDALNEQWNDFSSNDKARVLRWLIQADELRMIETFVQTEQDDAAGEIPELFLRFMEPFDDVHNYGATLYASLLEQFTASREELSDADVDTNWTPPPTEGRHSLIVFIEACASLQKHYREFMEKVAVVLTPASVADHSEFQRWLWVAAEHLPNEVRIAVVDDADAPVLAQLAEAKPEQVISTPANLDMPAAISELASATATSGPDGQFRVKFTALLEALSKGNFDGARSNGAAAIAIASEHGWTHLVVAVHLALGGGYLSAKSFNESVASYHEADKTATKLEQTDPIGSKLRLQAALGMAGVFFAAGDYAGAALRYEAAAPLAVKTEDAVMTFECWRMAAYCHEQSGKKDLAWDFGLRSLDAAEAIPADNRLQSTVPFAGDSLLRLADGSAQHEQFINQRMTQLTGTPDWRAHAVPPK
jgi:hypothetical protein